jgi:hypothetical protein
VIPLERCHPVSNGRKWATCWARGNCAHSRRALRSWRRNGGGLFVVCGDLAGHPSLGVLDCDDLEADAALVEFMGGDVGLVVLTHRGTHRYFEIRRGLGSCDLTLPFGHKVEFKANRRGVMAPGSPHPSGGHYAKRDPELWAGSLPELPECVAVLTSLMLPVSPTAANLSPGEDPPSVYVPLITGADVSREGFALCPSPTHDDHRPSLKVYSDSVTCYVCELKMRAPQLAALSLGLGTKRGWSLRLGPADREQANARLAELGISTGAAV